MFVYRYGGKNGESHALEIARDKVVIRTRNAIPLTDAIRDDQNATLLNSLVPLATWPEANVTVALVQAPEGEQLTIRDAIRRTLSAETEPEIRFAGRALQDPETGIPVIYTENLFVKFRPGVGHTTITQILDKYNLSIKRELEYSENGWFVALPDGSGAERLFAVAEALLDEPEIVLCHPELIRERRLLSTNQPAPAQPTHPPEQWHLGPAVYNGTPIDAHVNAQAAWAITRGEQITIAVIDDGFDLDHEEFRQAGKIVHPRDVTLHTNDPRPQIECPSSWPDCPPGYPDNHGTACAGTACASGNHRASGVAPDARLMPIRLRSGLGSQSEAEAFYHAARHGADVISCSWGPIDGDWRNPHDAQHHQRVALPDMTREAIRHAVTQGRGGKGCVIVWAAGNGNESVDNDGYASCEEAIAVAACNDRSRRCVYSDYGKAIWCAFPSNDFAWMPYNHPAPLTPGIWTTDRSGSKGYNRGLQNHSISPAGDDPGHYTNAFGGTSAACPGVAGVVALMLAVNPDLRWTEVKQLLREACVRIDEAGGSYGADGHSPYYGYGRVDAERVVRLAQSLKQPGSDIPHSDPVFDAITFSVLPAPSVDSLQLARGIVRETLGKTTWRVNPVPHMPDTFDAFYVGRGRVTQGKVWQWTAALRKHRDVLHAEPSFLVVLPDIAPTTRAFGDMASHDPRTANDFFWSLEQVRARQAWALVPPAGGATRGAGIRIAHPDSGFITHRELDAPRVLVNLGRNFIGRNRRRNINNPGGNHGLATGSVIISGDNPPVNRPVVTGSAPDALLVPLRVTQPRAFIPAPVLMETGMRALRDAIVYATESDFPIISISLGGPLAPVFLQTALRNAVNRGIIVLAAAGNIWPWVVWPAAFPEVIAVAGSNIGRRPWGFSASGRAVEVTAPAESVWNASVESGAQMVVRGNGTSFAVATVAGIAALWLAFHGRNNLINRYGRRGLVPVFREILRTQGTRQGTNMPRDKYGAGIVDAVNILQAPLPTTVPAREARLVMQDGVPLAQNNLEMLGMLFEDVSPERLRETLMDVFSVDETGLSADLAHTGDELLFRLMTDEALRAAFTRSLHADSDSRSADPASQPDRAAIRTVRQHLITENNSPRLAGQVREQP